MSTLCQDLPVNSSMVSPKESRHLWEMEIDDIKRRLRETGKTRAGLAKALGLDPAIITRMLQGAREVKLREVPVIKAYLEMDTAEPPVTNVSRPVESPVKDVVTQPQDVPVFGTVLGGKEGDFAILDETIEYVRRWPGIMTKTKVYALYVQGDSMADWAQSGDLIFVDPNQPPRVGDYVVIQMKPGPEGGTRAYVKRLLARTPTKLKVLQLNPRREIEFNADHVGKVHKVLSTKDLAGI